MIDRQKIINNDLIQLKTENNGFRVTVSDKNLKRIMLLDQKFNNYEDAITFFNRITEKE